MGRIGVFAKQKIKSGLADVDDWVVAHDPLHQQHVRIISWKILLDLMRGGRHAR